MDFHISVGPRIADYLDGPLLIPPACEASVAIPGLFVCNTPVLVRRTAVIMVTVIRTHLGVRREAGQIEFRGIPLTCGDGSTRIPVTAERKQVPFSFQCNPPGFVSDQTARQIAAEISCGFGNGKIGDDEWSA
jgi:hypothetical protein